MDIRESISKRGAADEQAECGNLHRHLARLGRHLDEYLRFETPDAMAAPQRWQTALQRPLPEQGVGIDAVVAEIGRYLLPNASQIPNPGCTSFITTGATSAGALATLAGAVAAPQRLGLHAFTLLEDLSLQWLAELFGLPVGFQGIYASGGSVANLLALGAARQRAFERIGIDPAKSGVQRPARVFASAESHHSIARACAVLGLGRDALVKIPCDDQGRMRADALAEQIERRDGVPMAIVGNLGTTNAGAIDPVADLARIARAHDIWLHLDGAYGLPGILDPEVAPLFDGMQQADSVIVDPHKWLGAPVGIGAAFVRDGGLLQRAFTQEPAAYLEGAVAQQDFRHSLDSLGTPYSEMGVELSAPSRGAVVWALLREIGRHGMRERVRRHNAMARRLARRVVADPCLELLREPTLSICCFRYVDRRVADLDRLNRELHRRLIRNSRNMPSTTQVNGKLAIRPCFIGARTDWRHADALLDEVRAIGAQLVAETLDHEQRRGNTAMQPRFDNILQTIGNTPVVRINKLAPRHVNLFVKMESFNPMGSVKDRLALGVIEDAERRGELKPGQTIVEATSGNTGIGLAMVCAQKGYPLVVTMAENFSVERRKLMRFLGARVILTPASEKGTGMVAKARELARQHGWFQSRQFENPANADIHARTTAVEILRAFEDLPLDYWVTGFGTGGTLSGVSRVLRQKSPGTRVVVCEPDNSRILASGVAQARNDDGTHKASHPNFRPHVMQGWSPDFISGIAQEVLDDARIDHFIPIDGNDALRYARELARQEGLFVGISSGATFAGALQVAEQAPEGSTILCMLPDTGERYMSTPLFADVPEEMTDEEIALSRSTAGCRFDVRAAAAPPAQEEPVDAGALKEMNELIADPQRPVVMFGLEWCEFCWSVRKLFEQYRIPYRSVCVDSAEYQQDDRGGALRAALKSRTGWSTLPQIFVGGEFVGGATDLFDECLNGRLKERLLAQGIAVRDKIKDPYGFLPKWLHPRSA